MAKRKPAGIRIIQRAAEVLAWIETGSDGKDMALAHKLAARLWEMPSLGGTAPYVDLHRGASVRIEFGGGHDDARGIQRQVAAGAVAMREALIGLGVFADAIECVEDF